MTARSTAASRKLAADVAEARGPASDAPFTFTTDAGDTITVPSLAVAEGQPNTLALAEARENNDTLLQTLLIVRAKVTPEVYAMLKRLPAAEFDRFSVEWAEHSGVTVGKSRVS